MWRKILWIVVVLYPVSVALTIASNAGSDATIGSLLSSFVFLLVPLGVLIFELRDGKPTKFWSKFILLGAYLISFVLLGVGTAGYYAFNTPTPFNISSLGISVTTRRCGGVFRSFFVQSTKNTPTNTLNHGNSQRASILSKGYLFSSCF